jgi:hypothetical protein
MDNYIVVLFKNKHKKKILKRFITEERAYGFFSKMIKKSEDIIFGVNYENGKKVEYEIAVIQKSSKSNIPTYLTDNLGRNIRIKLEDNDMIISQIKPYKKEEKIFDLKTNRKITVPEFIKKYLKTDTLKVISVLNNKIIVQKDDDINLFSLKNEDESLRFLTCLSNHFFKTKRSDCLFVNDTSTPQKKYLLNLLENNGFDKKILYRKHTTHPR